jgi:hypothetical protein
MKKMIIAILLLAVLFTGSYFVRQTSRQNPASTDSMATNELVARFGPAHPLQLHHQTNGLDSTASNQENVPGLQIRNPQTTPTVDADVSSASNNGPESVLPTLSNKTPETMATTPTVYEALPTGSKVTIDGEFKTHLWKMIGTEFKGFIELDPGITLDNRQPVLPMRNGVLAARTQAFIPVNSLHTTFRIKPDVLDAIYLETMRESQFPTIICSFNEFRLREEHVAGEPFGFDGNCQLTIAGITTNLAMQVTMASTPSNNDRITVTGHTDLKMSWFDLVIPKEIHNIGLGVLECADDVTVTFVWELARRTSQSSTGN